MRETWLSGAWLTRKTLVRRDAGSVFPGEVVEGDLGSSLSAALATERLGRTRRRQNNHDAAFCPMLGRAGLRPQNREMP